jgi:hypothetical protein
VSAGASLRRLLVTTLWLALPLYLLSLVLGLVGTAAALLGLGAVADRPWLSSLLGPGWLDVLIEFIVSASVAPPSDQMAVGMLALESVLVPPLLIVAQWIGYTFLAGGILGRLIPGSPDRTSRPTFWTDCRRWFWPFVRLGTLGTLLFLVLVALGSALAILASRVVGMSVSALALAAWLAILFGWLELARAALVWPGTRSIGNALELAARVVIRPRALALWLFLALPGLGLVAATAGVPRGGESASVITTMLTLVLGQVVAFVAAWLKVIRLAAACRLVATPDRARSAAAVHG